MDEDNGSDITNLSWTKDSEAKEEEKQEFVKKMEEDKVHKMSRDPTSDATDFSWMEEPQAMIEEEKHEIMKTDLPFESLAKIFASAEMEKDESVLYIAKEEKHDLVKKNVDGDKLQKMSTDLVQEKHEIMKQEDLCKIHKVPSEVLDKIFACVEMEEDESLLYIGKEEKHDFVKKNVDGDKLQTMSTYLVQEKHEFMKQEDLCEIHKLPSEVLDTIFACAEMEEVESLLYIADSPKEEKHDLVKKNIEGDKLQKMNTDLVLEKHELMKQQDLCEIHKLPSEVLAKIFTCAEMEDDESVLYVADSRWEEEPQAAKEKKHDISRKNIEGDKLHKMNKDLVQEKHELMKLEDLCEIHKLPSEVLTKIFSCLPVPSILHLRSVCRRWNCIILSRAFACLWSQLSVPHLPWIIMYHSLHMFAAYNPSANKWLTLADPFPAEIRNTRILASSGGLLCFGSFSSTRCTLIVCNPITQQWRFLPDIPLSKDKLMVGMITDKSRGCYKIYVTNSLDEEIAFWNYESVVYCSIENHWRPLQPSERLALEGCQRDHAIWCQGTCVSLSEGMPPHELLGYDVVKHRWISLELPFERSMSLSPPLSTRKGRLYLAAVEWEHLPFSSFNIWELDMPSWNFKAVAVRPCVPLFEDCYVSPLPSQALQRLGEGDFLFFHAKLSLSPLIYDLLEKSWYCLPRYLGPCKGWVPGLVLQGMGARISF